MKPDLFERHTLVFLIGLVLLFFWKLVFSSQYTFLDSPDTAFQVLPWYQVQARAWNAGEFPLWDPYQWAGQSLIGQMQPGVAFPLNWPLFLAPLKDGYINLDWVHLHFVSMHVLAALFMYALGRELGRSRYAALLVGVAFGCSGYVGSTGWPQMIHGAIWIPLIFVLFHRVVKARSMGSAVAQAVLCGGAVGLSLLSGHHQTPMYTLMALTAFLLVMVIRRASESKALAGRLAGLYAVVAVAAFLVAALQLLPGYEYGQEAYRWVNTPEPVTMGEELPLYVHTDLRLMAVSLLGVFVPRANLALSTFVGFVCLSMLVYAVATCWKERFVRGYFALAVGALAYSIGPLSIVHGWIYSLMPFADKARSPSHAIFVFQFAVLVVAGFGLDRLLDTVSRDERDDVWTSRIAKVLLGFAAVAGTLVLNHFLGGDLNNYAAESVVLGALSALGLAGLLAALQRKALPPVALRSLLLLLMMFEMSVAHSRVLMHRTAPDRPGYLDTLTELKGVTDFLKQQPRPFRFEIVTDGHKANIGSWEELEMVDGLLASASTGVYDFVARDWHPQRLRLNMVYTVVKERTRAVQTEVYHDPSGWKVFRNPDASGRIWAVSDTSVLDDPRDEGAGVPPPVEFCESAPRLLSYELGRERVDAKVATDCAGYVVFADPYFPGWAVEVDGSATPLYRAEGALRAVNLPAGEHDVRFVYRPRLVRAGGWLSGLGLLLCLGASVFVWRSRGLVGRPGSAT